MDDQKVIREIKRDRKIFINSFVGLAESNARNFVKGTGFTLRVMRRDGKRIFGTANLNVNRINIHVESEIVTKAYFG